MIRMLNRLRAATENGGGADADYDRERTALAQASLRRKMRGLSASKRKAVLKRLEDERFWQSLSARDLEVLQVAVDDQIRARRTFLIWTVALAAMVVVVLWAGALDWLHDVWTALQVNEGP